MANKRPLVIGTGVPQQFDGTVDTLDVNGAITVTGVSNFGSATSLAIPNAAGGTTVDATGEICVDSTSKTLNFYDGTSEVALNPLINTGIVVEAPVSTEDITMFHTEPAITVKIMRCVMVGTSPSVTWTIRHSTDRSAAGNEVVTAGTTTTSITTGSDITTFNDATIPADSWIWLETTAKSGTVTNMGITLHYTRDP